MDHSKGSLVANVSIEAIYIELGQHRSGNLDWDHSVSVVFKCHGKPEKEFQGNFRVSSEQG